MKDLDIFLIVATSIDGRIGIDPSSKADWTSKEDKAHFVELTKKAGVMVMGNNTWKTIGKALPNRLTIVMNHDKDTEEGNVVYTTKGVHGVVEIAKSKGYSSLAVCGGSSIYTQFLKEKLPSRLYLTVEPTLIGQGVPFVGEKISCSFVVTDCEKRGNSIFITYNITY